MASPLPNVDSATSTTQTFFELGSGSLQGIGLFFIKLCLAALFVSVVFVGAKLLTKYIRKRIQQKSISEDDYAVKSTSMINSIVFYVLLTIAVIIGLKIVGVDLSMIMWGISFAIGFAFMDLFGNMIAGVFILSNKEFKIGNIIEIEEAGDVYFGRVENITIRYTVIRLLTRRRVVVPNLRMITRPITTFDSDNIVRLSFQMKIHHSTPIPRGLTIIKDAINSVSFVKDPANTLVNIESLQDNYLHLLIYFYYDPQTGMLRKKAKGQVQEAIFKACKENNIHIPYSHKVVTVDPKDHDVLETARYMLKYER